MKANVDLEKVASLLGETIDFVRINLQYGTLIVDGQPIGYAVKKRENQKNFFYVVDPIRLVKYLEQLKEANEKLDNYLALENEEKTEMKVEGDGEEYLTKILNKYSRNK